MTLPLVLAALSLTLGAPPAPKQEWKVQLEDTTVTGDLTAVHFATASAGTAVGKGLVFQTDDGGATWKKRTGVVGSRGGGLRGVFMTDATHAFAVGANGRMRPRPTAGRPGPR